MVVHEAVGHLLVTSTLVIEGNSIIKIELSLSGAIHILVDFESNWLTHAVGESDASVVEKNWEDSSLLDIDGLDKISKVLSDGLTSS